MSNKILYIISIICWMAVIFFFSARDSVESTRDSRGLITNTVTVGAATANKLGIIEEMPSNSEITTIAKNLDHPIRKLAHATVYLVLALLILLALDTNADNFFRNAAVAVILCFLYALTDEYHQTFVSGRSGELGDCFIDSVGAMFACCFYGIGTIIRKKHNS